MNERVTDVRVSDEELTVRLKDGRTITVPLAWYPKLLDATPKERKNWTVAGGGGYGIHWPDIDEDLSTEGLLRGAPAPRIESRSGHRKLPAKTKGAPLIAGDSPVEELVPKISAAVLPALKRMLF